jgi:hypothetical protein
LKETHDREVDVGRCSLCTVGVDILDPAFVLVKAVGRDSDDLYVAFFEIVGSSCDLTKFRRADGGKVSRVGEKDTLDTGRH